MEPAREISIAGLRIGGSAPCFVIAEIGINHGGDEAVCTAMIEAAAKAGADAVKLQTVTPEESYHPETPSYRMFAESQLPEGALARLMAHADGLGIMLFSTPGDFSALAALRAVGVPAIKISSGLLTNTPLIRAAAETGKPLILSTGMAEMSEVETAIATAREGGCEAFAVLQCTSLYPAPTDSLNLRAMTALRDRFQVPVGFSDHHDGALACIAAVAAGASLIEKHFTLDRSAPGADHRISLQPDAFAAMMRDIRSVEAMLGSAAKAPDEAELLLREERHRRLVAARDLAAGETIRPDDVFLMRLPAQQSAIAAGRFGEVLGRTTKVPIARLAGLTEENVDVRP